MNNTILIDTNIVSYLFKRDSRALPYLHEHLDNKAWLISFMTLAELYRWAVKYQWGKAKKDRLEAYLSKFTVIPYDQYLCWKWAEVVTECQGKGKSIDHPDAWIAATALLYDLPLVTHNSKHFENIESIQVLSV